ncbi:MAG: hypothetical protein RRB13_15280 [bacterium]|nr:hypothetical protein [bacterium]
MFQMPFDQLVYLGFDAVVLGFRGTIGWSFGVASILLGTASVLRGLINFTIKKSTKSHFCLKKVSFKIGWVAFLLIYSILAGVEHGRYFARKILKTTEENGNQIRLYYGQRSPNEPITGSLLVADNQKIAFRSKGRTFVVPYPERVELVGVEPTPSECLEPIPNWLEMATFKPMKVPEHCENTEDIEEGEKAMPEPGF